jgi:long-chain acyl-CoA synthetase
MVEMTSVRSVTGSTDVSRLRLAPSLPHLLLERVAHDADREAFRHPVGDAWVSLTWAQSWERIERIAAALLDLGLRRGDRVGIASATRLEWLLVDLGTLCAGGATTTVYPSTGGEDFSHILSDSGSVVVFAEDAGQLDKLRKHRQTLPEVRLVVVIDPDGVAATDDPDDDWVTSLAAFEERGAAALAADAGVVRRVAEALRPDDLATLVYTSGTTGRPKGVRLTHKNWTYEAAAIEDLGILDSTDVHYLWLPLAHVFGKTMEAAQLQIGYATVVDGRVDTIVANMQEVRPTFMCGVPRIFEKVHAAAETTGAEGGAAKAAVFQWAFRVGHRAAAARAAGRRMSPLLTAQHGLAHKLVFSHIHERFGGRLRWLVSGSAPLSADIAAWFDAAGLVVLEGYGLTETSAAVALNRPGRVGYGTVGEPLTGTQLGLADDGEVYARGPAIMSGYQGEAASADAEVLLDDGWFATGDVGEIDGVGRLRLTDRKKDLVKTSTGKYLAPGAIASRFAVLCPIVGQMVVLVRSYAVALISLDPDALEAWARRTGAVPEGAPFDFATTAASPQVHEQVADAVARLNEGLAHWETVNGFEILDRPLTVEDGELTPSLKVKRVVVAERYATLVDRAFASSAAVHAAAANRG